MDALRLNPLKTVYVPLGENECMDKDGFSKQTVMYATNNIRAMKTHIAKCARKNYSRILDYGTIEDIYSETLFAMTRAADFDYSTAEQRTLENGRVFGLGDYVKKQFDYGVKRYFSSNVMKYERQILDQEVKDSGSESGKTCLMDLQADPDAHKFTDVVDLEQTCELISGDRYKYSLGKDLFTIMFVQLCAMRKYGCDYINEVNGLKEENKDACVKTVLDVLGIKESDISSIGDRHGAQSIMLDIVAGVNKCGIDRAISVLRHYVFGADQIEIGIKRYKN